MRIIPDTPVVPGPRLFATPWRAIVLLAVFASASLEPAGAQTCTVPGTHATIQGAIDDPACTTINLSAQSYPESINIQRSLTLAGPAPSGGNGGENTGGGGAVVEGLVRVVGAGTLVNTSDLAVRNGCPLNALLVLGGAQTNGMNLTVERSAALPCPASLVFADGFESGDTAAWSSQVP